MSLFTRVQSVDYLRAETLTQLQARSRQLQKAMWQQEHARLMAIACKILGSLSEAENLVADALTDFLFQHVDGLHSSRAIPAYLRIMVIRRASRRRDQAWRHDNIEDLNAFTDPHDSVSTADENIDQRTWLLWLEHCLQLLKGRARQILKLHFGHELSYAQIGAQLGVSKQAIGKAVSKSEQLLKQCIQEQSARKRG